MRKILIITIITLCVYYSSAFAQAGSLDPSFGFNNYFKTNFSDPGAVLSSIDISPDDKIVAVGSRGDDAVVMRLNPNGTIDTSFGNMGYVTLDPSLGGGDMGTDVKVLSGGKVLVSIYSLLGQDTESRLVRFNANGTLDDTFGNFGVVTLVHNSRPTMMRYFDIDGQGRIVWGGQYKNNNDLFRWLIARFNSDGTIDSTFSSDGFQEFVNVLNNNDETLEGIKVLGNSIYVLGDNDPFNADANVFVAKLNEAGNLDMTYGNQGQGRFIFTVPSIMNEYHTGFDVNSNGELWISGYQEDQGVIIKVTPAGEFDQSFGIGGILTVPSVEAFPRIKQQGTDKIVVFGAHMLDLIVAVYNTSDGTPYSGFGAQGMVTHNLDINLSIYINMDLGFQSSGNIIMAGSGAYSWDTLMVPQMMVSRILKPGAASIDENITEAPFVVYPNPAYDSFHIRTESDDPILKVELLSMSGERLYVWNNITSQHDLPDNIASGMYMLRVQSEKTFSNQILSVIR